MKQSTQIDLTSYKNIEFLKSGIFPKTPFAYKNLETLQNLVEFDLWKKSMITSYSFDFFKKNSPLVH